MNKHENNLFLEQRNNCFFALIVSLLFIIGLILKTITNSSDLINDIKNVILLIIPIIFMNSSFFTILLVFKNFLTNKNIFNSYNNKMLNILMILLFIFFLSIVLIINKDTTGISNLYCLILISINFLYSAYLFKKIFNYGIELKK